MGDASDHLHFDEVRATATTTLETIRRENVGAWINFSTMVHFSPP
jgi:hypothetical protein